MKIAICDDQNHFRRQITENLLKYRDTYCAGEEWEITEFTDGNVLIAEEEKRDLYFLDLEMPAMDGIQVAAGLQSKWQDCNIIIMTSHVERMKEGYQVKAFRFMTKPVEYDEMKEGLDTFFKSRIGYDTITLQSFGTAYTIMHRDIRYICKESGDTVVYVKELKFRSKQSMEEWENILDSRMFFRCHKSYIANLRFVEDVTAERISFDNGEVIPVSRRKKTDLYEKMKVFDLTYGG